MDQIHFLLVINRQGRTRVAKWFSNYSVREQRHWVAQIHKLVLLRDSKHQLNFVECQGVRLVYRRYAGLFFVCGVGVGSNELACLESLHLVVEVLDRYFDNVCELDLVFNFHKVGVVVDEVFVAGGLAEVSEERVGKVLKELEALG